MAHSAIVTREFTFEAAHSLANHRGKCRYLHGHSYRLQISVRGPLIDAPGHSDDGMVMDLDDLKTLVNASVIETLADTVTAAQENESVLSSTQGAERRNGTTTTQTTSIPALAPAHTHVMYATHGTTAPDALRTAATTPPAIESNTARRGMDHNNLNQLTGIRTTAENLVHWIWDALVAAGLPDHLIYRIRLYETERGYIEITHAERETGGEEHFLGE